MNEQAPSAQPQYQIETNENTSASNNQRQQEEEKSSEGTEPSTKGQFKLIGGKLPAPSKQRNLPDPGKNFKFEFKPIAEKNEEVPPEPSKTSKKSLLNKSNTMTRSRRKRALAEKQEKEQSQLMKTNPISRPLSIVNENEPQTTSVFANPMSSSKALRDLRKSVHSMQGKRESSVFGIPVSNSPAK